MGSWVGDMIERTNNAMRIGRLQGRVRGLSESIEKWREYANELESSVDYFRALAGGYRREALTGWAYWRAAKEYAKEHGFELSGNPEIEQKVEKHFKDEGLREAVDKDAKEFALKNKQ